MRTQIYIYLVHCVPILRVVSAHNTLFVYINSSQVLSVCVELGSSEESVRKEV